LIKAATRPNGGVVPVRPHGDLGGRTAAVPFPAAHA
jgi:hypothetical protein